MLELEGTANQDAEWGIPQSFTDYAGLGEEWPEYKPLEMGIIDYPDVGTYQSKQEALAE
ncbi:MAG TPA: hypothetical protein VJL83_00970 [Patescibacteria group bacterium]|nr:hypothetical protein [Patescibacteria group bacterium]